MVVKGIHIVHINWRTSDSTKRQGNKMIRVIITKDNQQSLVFNKNSVVIYIDLDEKNKVSWFAWYAFKLKKYISFGH